jgi:hypothetical protein
MRIPGLAVCIAGAAAALAAALPASAQLSRTAVSVAGNDANNCAVATPCRSFARAITQTSPGGEVVALDSAGFGPFTVDRSVTVQAAPGVHAGVTQTAGNAVQISAGATDRVVLRGLVINGMGTASAGIAFTGGGAETQVENCVVTGFVDWGIISFLPIRVQDTIVRESGIGVHIDNAGGPVNATLERVQLQNNAATGVFSWRNARVTVRDTVAALNGTGFRASDGGVLNIENSMATENGTGVTANMYFSGGGTVRMSNTMVVNNAIGVEVGSGTVETWQNNRIRGNTTNLSGALTPVTLK